MRHPVIHVWAERQFGKGEHLWLVSEKAIDGAIMRDKITKIEGLVDVMYVKNIIALVTVLDA